MKLIWTVQLAVLVVVGAACAQPAGAPESASTAFPLNWIRAEAVPAQWLDPFARYDGGAVTRLDLAVSIDHAPDWVRVKFTRPENRWFIEQQLRWMAVNNLVTRQLIAEYGLPSWHALVESMPHLQAVYDDGIDELLRRHLIVKAAQPSEEEAFAYYEDHLHEFMGEERFGFQRIFVQIGDASSEAEIAAAEKQAQAILAELAAGAEFAELARRYAQLCEGDHDRAAAVTAAISNLHPAQLEALKALEVGAATGVVRTHYGFEILKLVQPRFRQPRPFGEVAGEARQRLHLLRRGELAQRLQETRVDLEMPVLSYSGPPMPDVPAARQPAYMIGGATVTRGALETLRRRLAVRQDNAQELDEASLVLRLQWLAWAKATGFDRHPVVFAELRQRVEREVARAERERLFPSQPPEPTEEQLRAHYDKHPERYRGQEKVRGRMLTIRSLAWGAGIPEAVVQQRRRVMRDKQQAAQRDLEAGVEFAEVVRRYSTEAGEVDSGGLMRLPEQLNAEFVQLIGDTQPGYRTRWREEDDVRQIALVEEREPAPLLPFEEALEQAKSLWRQDWEQEQNTRWELLHLGPAGFAIDWEAVATWDPLAALPPVLPPPAPHPTPHPTP